MLNKNLLTGVLTILSSGVFAENNLTQEAIANQDQQVSSSGNYIARGNYLENPYLGMPSGGGTAEIAESQLQTMNAAQKLFSSGTWNVFGAYSYVNQNGANNNGYAINLFAQTGSLAGFSVGGLMTIANPFYSEEINPAVFSQQAGTLPIEKQVTPQELFLEYQYSNIVQADAGWIGISNSPWMTYYQNNSLNLMTYQGALVNLHPGGGWLLTGFAINKSQLYGEEGFGQYTMYNTNFDYGTGTANIGQTTTPGALGFGASWSDITNNYNFRLWAYQFADYADLFYADTTIKLPVNDQLGFTLGFQGAVEGGNGSVNILTDNGYGDIIQSNMLGVQLGFNYSIFGLQLGYNNIWGPCNAYECGGLVSPYTYQVASDPLYTTGWMQGMVEKSSGQAYKIAPSLSLLNGNLIISPSYQYYLTSIIPSSSEYDLTISYSVPEIKGLTFFGGYGYIQQPFEAGGDTYQGQLMVSYLY